MEYKILNSTFSPQEIRHFGFFQYDEAIYLNNCVILRRFLPNRVTVYLVIQAILLSQLYSNSN